jgi:NAD(P)-dependent dehydrogenase (short-subunit alcohol dehydrogenase family)
MAGTGWTVFAGVRHDRDGDQLLDAVAGDVRPVILDVTEAAQISAAVAELGDRLDGLVNNAGVGEGGPIEALSDNDWRWHFDVNVFGLVNVTRECLPLLRSARGRVVNIASVGGRVAMPMMAPYAAGKHAVEAISESLRFEVADFGMKVACVEPGSVATAIWAKADDQLARASARVPTDLLARYQRHFDMLYGFVADGARRGIPPAKAAHAVHHALTSDRPRHRYLVGRDAKVVGLVSRLPDPLRYRMLTLNFAQMERAGRTIRLGQSTTNESPATRPDIEMHA